MQLDNYLEQFIDFALKEDIGDGDHTSLATIPNDITGKVQLIVKQEGILAGSSIAFRVFQKLDPTVEITQHIADGSPIKPGETAFVVKGKILQLLQAERLVLNIMQRMSGVASETNKYVRKLEGLNTKVLDTRKTTPGMRLLDKLAVKTGGGENHRIGLYDMILIKDNHIDFAGGIEKSIKLVKSYLKEKKKTLKIEIEARSIDDIKKILDIGGIDRILLDNFTVQQTRQAVELIERKVESESSGNINLENIRDYAECGVDYISVGALTHQIKSLDLSLKALDF